MKSSVIGTFGPRPLLDPQVFDARFARQLGVAPALADVAEASTENLRGIGAASHRTLKTHGLGTIGAFARYEGDFAALGFSRARADVLDALRLALDACSPKTPPSRTDHITPAVRVIEASDGETIDLSFSRATTSVNGAKVDAFVYGGAIPGPVIKVKQGSTLTVNLKNETGGETALHPHGLRIDNAFDGIPGLTQAPTQPGETFTHELRFLDAGVFPFHPHVDEALAIEHGAYGMFVVEPEDPNYYNPVNREVPLFLDDILIDDETNAVVPLSGENPDRTLMGRYGNTLLTNYRPDYSLEVNQGDVVRFHLLATSNAAPFNFGIPGAKVKLVAGDCGKYERETFVDNVLIGPFQRRTVEVLFEAPGKYDLKNMIPGGDGHQSFGEVVVHPRATDESHAAAFFELRENTDVTSEIDRYRHYFDQPPTRRLKLDLEMTMSGDHEMSPAMDHGSMPRMNGGMDHGAMSGTGMDHEMPGMEEDPAGGIEWRDGMPDMNARTNTHNVTWKMVDLDTGKANMDVVWKMEPGRHEVVEIQNDPSSPHPMQHPIHFHGIRILPFAEADLVDGHGEPTYEVSDNLAWQDTVMIPAGKAARVLLELYDEGDGIDCQGKWMAHCHIAEHLAAGMMTRFDVGDVGDIPSTPADPPAMAPGMSHGGHG